MDIKMLLFCKACLYKVDGSKIRDVNKMYMMRF